MLSGRAASWAARWWTTAALLALGAAGGFWYAMAQPAYSTGDELVHVDYAYQLWLGRFPHFFDGPLLDPGVGYRPGLQWVEQHPPLLYAILAPFVGPLVQSGHPVDAVLAARAVLVVMGALSVLAVRWTVRGAFPGREGVALAAALLYALSSWFPRQSGAVYNDLPAVLAITVAMGFLFRAVRSPRTRRPVVGLALALCVASLVRFSALPLAAGLLLALATHRVVVLRRPLRAVVEVLACSVAVVVASGWWWYRNQQATGNLQGSRADYWVLVQGWQRQSLPEAADGDFWRTMLQQFFSTTFLRPVADWEARAWWGVALLLLLPVVIGLVSVVADLWRARRTPELGRGTIVLLTLLGSVAVVVVTQIGYSMSSGSDLPRYFFALVPSAAVLMAYGFCRHRALLALLVVWVLVRLWLVAVELQSTLDRPLPGRQAPVHETAAWIGYGVVVVTALALLVAVLRRASDRTPVAPVAPSPTPATAPATASPLH